MAEGTLYQPSSIMGPETWLVLVDHKFRALGDCFWVQADNIHNLKMQVKELWANDLARVHAAKLSVWKTKGTMIINESTFHVLEDILRKINISDKNTIEELSGCESVADLGLSDGQMLLVQLPVPGASYFSLPLAVFSCRS
jgi:hypothetical protein